MKHRKITSLNPLRYPRPFLKQPKSWVGSNGRLLLPHPQNSTWGAQTPPAGVVAPVLTAIRTALTA